MKKLALLLVTLLVSSFAISPVYAKECDDNVFRQATKGEVVDEGYDLPEQIHAGDTARTWNAVNVNDFYFTWAGTMGKCPSSTLQGFMENERENTQVGLAQVGFSSTYTAFLTPPSGNIPAFYANMLLPKELTGNGSSVYAQSSWLLNNSEDCSSGGLFDGLVTVAPACESAWTYWGTVGIQDLWSVSFTLSMLVVVFILILSGFMVMFRSRIGGQTIVSVTMALQNVVMGAFFALGSYAFGIFFVNLSKYLTMVVANLFLVMLWNTLETNWLTDILFSHVATTYINSPAMFVKFVGILFLGDLTEFSSTAWGILGVDDVGGFMDILKGLSNLPNVTGQLIAYAGLEIVKAMSPIYIISRLIIFVALFLVSIRIFWTMLQVYIKMAIDVVLAPLIFIFGAIPGSTNNMKEWFTRMLRNSLIPPAMFALTNVALYVTIKMADTIGTMDSVAAITGGYAPNRGFTGFLLYLVGPQSIVMLIILNMVPSVPTLMSDLFTGKSTGAMAKAGDEVKKQLQKVPLLGGLVK